MTTVSVYKSPLVVEPSPYDNMNVWFTTADVLLKLFATYMSDYSSSVWKEMHTHGIVRDVLSATETSGSGDEEIAAT